MDACSGDGVRWSKGGSRAATGGSDAAASANLPEPCACAGDPARDGREPNDAARIQALLLRLSEVRLTVSADLSAAAGALDDDRADIANDLIAGARGELARLRAATRRRASAPSPLPPRVAAAVGACGPAQPLAQPEARVPEQRAQPRRRLVRALAGAAALAVAIAVLPQVAGGRSHPSTGAAGLTGAEQSPDIRLASTELTLLSQQLLAADAADAADAAPATIVAAERSWQGAIAGSLPSASTQPATASAVVTMLRQERALVLASPALRAPANHLLATSLAAGSQNLLSQLRRLADPQVLAILPTVLKVLPLPIPGAATAAPAGSTPSPGTTGPTGATPGAGSTATPTAPSAGATNPAAPSQPTSPTGPPASNGPLPLPNPGKVLPVPLPSTLGQLRGGGTDSPGLGQTLGNVLNGLGLGG